MIHPDDIPVPAPTSWQRGTQPANVVFLSGETQPLHLAADDRRYRVAYTQPQGCTGDCDNGTRDCTCGRAIIGPPVGMWDAERARPGRAALFYALFLLAGLLWAHAQAAGWL